jgi:hypothetical protein
VIDWSGGRPMDSLSGEAGWISETGIRVMLDPFMAQLAASEATGVFAFYHDNLLRVAAYNYHHFTCCGEIQAADDEGEAFWVGGDAAYVAEQLGALRPGVDPFRDVAPADVQVTTPHYGYVEPASDDQIPFHRSRDYRGYLGQGGRRMVTVPPIGDVFRRSGTAGGEGVFEEFRSLTGRASTRSAKGIHLVKAGPISAPKPMRRPEDPSGDTRENYRPGGGAGGGPPHVVTGGPEASDRFPHLQQVAGILDLHAWAFEWEGMHPFHYHANDWHLAEPAESALGAGAAPPMFGRLSSEFYLPRPDALKLAVDPRYGEVDYYPNEASLDLNDDGTVVAADGYGAEIAMAGGHIFLRCPGDIWFLPGRNINGWAGRDLCLRARNSWDISAAKGDGRAKAEKNLHLLGGNDGKAGGILLESKAPSAYSYDGVVGEDVVTGGVQVKAAKGAFVTWTRDVYMRIGGGDVDSGGEVVIDADKGRAPIITNSQSFLRYVSDAAADYLGTEGQVKVANVYGREGAILGTPVEVMGTGIFSGSVLIKGWVECVGGHIATELAQNPNYVYVSPLKDKPLAEARRILAEADRAEKKAVAEGTKDYKAGFTDYWYADDGPGNDGTIRAAHFTYRSGDHYRTKDFELYEARWQQLSRLAGQALAKWTEPPVVAGSRETYPYPGKAAWKDGDHLHRQGLSLRDPDTGLPKGRRAAQGEYESPRYASEDAPVALDGHYTVIP